MSCKVKKAAVVGERGQMGNLFARRCEQAGIEIGAINRPLETATIREAVRGADLVLLSVPAPAMDPVLEQLVPHMEPHQILMDNVSVKVAPMAAMLRHYDGPVVGTHPLFGPDPDPEFQRVAVVPGRDDAACALVDELMAHLGFTPFRTTAEEHDQAVAHIQGLNFVTSVAYLATLSHEEQWKDFLTPSFHRRLEAAKKMLTEDAELFAMLFEANPYGQDAVRRFRNFLHVAAGGDVDILVQRARWWWEQNNPEPAADNTE